MNELVLLFDKEENSLSLSKCHDKLLILKQQRIELMVQLDMLLSDLKSGGYSYTPYQQMKMYNDPELNPVLYEKREVS